MKYRTHRDALVTGALLLIASVLVAGNAQAQARGPSAKKIQQDGQTTISARDARDLIGQFESARRQQEQLELRNSPALLAARLAGIEDFLHRLPGRFRIEGRIEEPRYVVVSDEYTGAQGGLARVMQHKDISGSAVCSTAADAKVHCSIDAEWLPVAVEDGVRPLLVKSRSVNPTVLTLDVDGESAQIRSQLTAAEAIAEQWITQLDGHAAKSSQMVSCRSQRCFSSFELIAEPESDAVTIVMQDSRYTIHLTMHREEQASTL